MDMLRIIRNTLRACVDLVLPPRARTVRLARAAQDSLPITPVTERICGTEITTLLTYHAPGAEDAIRALKYDGSALAARILAEALEEFLREEFAEVRAFSSRQIILVPVPLHRVRERERGFNQIARVLACLPPEYRDGSLAQIEVCALTRTRKTTPQTRLSRHARLRNVRGAFAADPALVRDAHVYIVDDVCTTGATLAACANAARAHGARVRAIALARA